MNKTRNSRGEQRVDFFVQAAMFVSVAEMAGFLFFTPSPPPLEKLNCHLQDKSQESFQPEFFTFLAL